MATCNPSREAIGKGPSYAPEPSSVEIFFYVVYSEVVCSSLN